MPSESKEKESKPPAFSFTLDIAFVSEPNRILQLLESLVAWV